VESAWRGVDVHPWSAEGGAPEPVVRPDDVDAASGSPTDAMGGKARATVASPGWRRDLVVQPAARLVGLVAHPADDDEG